MEMFAKNGIGSSFVNATAAPSALNDFEITSNNAGWSINEDHVSVLTDGR